MSSVAEHMIAQHSAIKMLHSRVKLILAYIKAIESGALPANIEILREAYALSQRLPVIQTSAFKEEYYTVTTTTATKISLRFPNSIYSEFLYFVLYFLLAIK